MEVLHAGANLAQTAARFLADTLARDLRSEPRVSLALSGGKTPWPVFELLARTDLEWDRVDVYQVDERVAPAGDPARNLTGLTRALLEHVPSVVHPMPVHEQDLEAAADVYATELPESLDIVHLGLGDDGHTASLVPGDPVLDVVDRDVAVTRPYHGYRRMTLTLPVLQQARCVVWIVAGVDKAPMIERLLAADPTIPAGRVPQDRAVLIL